MMKLPVDILIDIIECVDHPRDLLSLALTARALYAEIVPKHIDYRRIVCPLPFSEHVWGHLLDTPNACSRIRYLDVSYSDPINQARMEPEVPRMCKINPSWKTRTSFTTNGPNIFQVFLRALSKMINLKVLKFGAMSQNLFSTSEAIGKANCDLEELDMFLMLPMTGAVFDQYFEENKISKNRGKSPLFYDYLSSLRKYTIRDNRGVPTPRRHTGVPLQMLLNAPNLTHMNVSSLRLPEFLLCYWPNLQHLVFRFLGEFHRDTTGKSYTYYLRMFLSRHSKLITFSTYRALRPGWATEWDSFLPNLKSLEFHTYYPLTNVPIIPTRIAERLTHLEMSAVLQSDLKDREIVLFNLETCVYRHADPEASIGDLVAVIPNILKLHIEFLGGDSECLFPPKPTTADEIVCHLPSFAKFLHLRVLSGPFNRLDISVHDNPFPKLLYELPSLSYIWGKLNGKASPECLRLERDNVARTTRFEPVTDRLAEDECDVESWGGFYRRKS